MRWGGESEREKRGEKPRKEERLTGARQPGAPRSQGCVAKLRSCSLGSPCAQPKSPIYIFFQQVSWSFV